MSTFTDLLDAYLDAKNDLCDARKNFEGYNFERLVERERLAREALNDAFFKATIGVL
jgi:hypothetical protein